MRRLPIFAQDTNGKWDYVEALRSMHSRRGMRVGKACEAGTAGPSDDAGQLTDDAWYGKCRHDIHEECGPPAGDGKKRGGECAGCPVFAPGRPDRQKCMAMTIAMVGLWVIRREMLCDYRPISIMMNRKLNGVDNGRSV